MEQKKKIWISVLAFVVLAMLCIVIFGDSPEEAARKQQILTERAIAEDALRESKCPSKGILQTNQQYCVQLCMLEKDVVGSFCDQICRDMKRLDGSAGSEFLDSQIQDFKCSNCGDCTSEQLKKLQNTT